MWWIASVPFWILGSVLFLAAIVWAIEGLRGKEPIKKSASEFVGALLVSGLLFVIAAKIAS